MAAAPVRHMRNTKGGRREGTEQHRAADGFSGNERGCFLLRFCFLRSLPFVRERVAFHPHAHGFSPSITVCSIHIDTKVQQKLHDVVVASTDSIV